MLKKESIDFVAQFQLTNLKSNHKHPDEPGLPEFTSLSTQFYPFPWPLQRTAQHEYRYNDIDSILGGRHTNNNYNGNRPLLARAVVLQSR